MRIFLTTLTALWLGTAASAQDVYVGGSVDYLLPHAGDSQTVTSAIVGMGFDTGYFSIGAEADYGLRVGGDNDYDTARVRGWLGYDWGDYTVLAGGGITEYYFEDSTSGGFHAMLGPERALTPDLTLRGVFIRDFMDNNFTSAITASRIAVLYQF